MVSEVSLVVLGGIGIGDESVREDVGIIINFEKWLIK